MGFREAVQNTENVAHAYRPGLQAIRATDRGRLSCGNTRSLAGSIDLDGALAVLLPDDPRWDYGVALKSQRQSEKVFWIEVHPASSHHIDEVLRKLAWLKTWLRRHGPQLNTLPREFVWIASGAVALQANSPQRRKIAAQGLVFAGQHLFLS